MELSSVQMVTQYIFIQLNDPTFKSLRFLKNLERIEGRGLFKYLQIKQSINRIYGNLFFFIAEANSPYT